MGHHVDTASGAWWPELASSKGLSSGCTSQMRQTDRQTDTMCSDAPSSTHISATFSDFAEYFPLIFIKRKCVFT